MLQRLRRPRQRSRATMIVGMHRSGTSFLTGTLQQCGLELGKHSTWNSHNRRGNRENGDIVAFHEDILTARGAAWNRPPQGAVQWSPEERERGRAIVDGYRDVPHWGFKDPRSLLLVEGWQALLPGLGFVGIFRHPEAVARSLAARGGMGRAQSYDLWQAYNGRLLRLHARTAFPVLCFDDPPDVLLAKVADLAPSLGLRAPTEAPFFSAELKHHRAEDVGLPDDVAATLRSLRDITL